MGHEGTQKPAVRMAPAMSSACCRVISSPQNSLPCPSVVTYPTDHINKVRQERSDLGVGLQVLEGDLHQLWVIPQYSTSHLLVVLEKVIGQ